MHINKEIILNLFFTETVDFLEAHTKHFLSHPIS